MRESGTRNSPLPPSIEKAYHEKCIAMKRRLREVEETNDAARLRVGRIDRAITKMRIERAILLDALAKKQQQIGKEDESDKSESEPPSPRDQAANIKRKRSSAQPSDRNAPTSIPTPSALPQYPPTAAPHHSFAPPFLPSQHYPSATVAGAHHASNPPILRSTPYPPPTLSYASPTAAGPPGSGPQRPKINSLPNGTSVMLIAPGTPKPSPWTINELDPRHHYKPHFDQLDLDEQEAVLFGEEYLPFDIFGKPIRVEYFPSADPAAGPGRYRHVFPTEEAWTDPIVNSVRRDAAEFREPVGEHGRRRFRKDGGAGAGPAAPAAAGVGTGRGLAGRGHSRLESDGVAAARDRGRDREVEDVKAERRDLDDEMGERRGEEGMLDHGQGQSGPGGFTAVNR